jgi:hypothetical protein
MQCAAIPYPNNITALQNRPPPISNPAGKTSQYPTTARPATTRAALALKAERFLLDEDVVASAQAASVP